MLHFFTGNGIREYLALLFDTSIQRRTHTVVSTTNRLPPLANKNTRTRERRPERPRRKSSSASLGRYHAKHKWSEANSPRGLRQHQPQSLTQNRSTSHSSHELCTTLDESNGTLPSKIRILHKPNPQEPEWSRVLSGKQHSLLQDG